jgi:K+-transporting ATPase ATPase C chain
MIEPPGASEGTGWRHLAHEARHTITVVLVLVVLTGAIFPALVLGLGQALLGKQADGTLVRNAQGDVVGSELIGQNFSGAEYFHPRPSAAGAGGYDASSSSGANYGPNNPDLIAVTQERAATYREENGLAPDTVLPADAVTTSASGLDPDISPANAFLQARRVAQARGMTEDEVRALVDKHTDQRFLWFLGEPRVNVLLLNLALDKEHPAATSTSTKSGQTQQ